MPPAPPPASRSLKIRVRFYFKMTKVVQYVHLINAIFPDLGVYIVLINAILKRGAIVGHDKGRSKIS